MAATPSKLYAYMAKGSRQMSVVRAAQELRERGRGGGVRAGYREVTATEALYRLDPSLSFTSSTFGQVVRVSAYLGARGQVAATADKLRYSARPATLCHLSLCQFLMYYRVARAEEQGRAHQQAAAVIPLIVAWDTNLVPTHLTHLPAIIILHGGQEMRRCREPRVVSWTPATDYARIVLFKVSFEQIFI